MKRVIRSLSFVTKLSPVGGRNSHGDGYQVSLRCPSCEEYGRCGKKQESPVQVSSVHPTEFACLHELLKRLQDRYFDCAEAVAKKAAAAAASAATVSPDTSNVLQAMMQLEQAKSRAEATNKLVLEAEKERDAAEKAVEELKRQLHPRRARTDDDAGDAHEMLAEVDNWDLRDHRLVVHGMLACAWSRTRIPLLWTESHGGRLYTHQADLLDRRRIYCHDIIRDSES